MRKVLFVAWDVEDMRYLAELRSRGLTVVGTRPSHAPALVDRWVPSVAILVRCGTHMGSPPQRLVRNRVPVVVVGSVDDFAAVDRVPGVPIVTVPDPSAPGEIATAVEAVLGESPPHEKRPDEVEVGTLHIDFDAGRATLSGEPLALPPKEFAILGELALRAGEPVLSAELVRRVWPEGALATIEDVHRHVYRLRKRLESHREEGCAPVRVVNRRGFGYELILPDG